MPFIREIEARLSGWPDHLITLALIAIGTTGVNVTATATAAQYIASASFTASADL